MSQFSQLDVLDLHDNHLGPSFELSCLSECPNLKIINLSNNKLQTVSLDHSIPSLKELNIRQNKVTSITITEKLDGLNKLYLSNNQLSSLEFIKSNTLPALQDFTLENNPISTAEPELRSKLSALSSLSKHVVDKIVSSLQSQRPSEVPLGTLKEVCIEKSAVTDGVNNAHVAAKSQLTAAKKKAQDNAVIKIIQKEWEKEMERLDYKKNGVNSKFPQAKNYGDKSLIQSGHAEIEANKVLYIYGNALEVL